VGEVRVLDAPNHVLVSWSPARDDTTPRDRLVYEVVMAPAGSWGTPRLSPTETIQQTTRAGETSVQLLLPEAQIGRDHWVRVRARDAAGNVDQNEVTRAVTLRFARQAVYPPLGGAVLTTALDLGDGRLMVAGSAGALGVIEPGHEPRVFPPVTSADVVALARYRGQVVGLTHTGQLLVVDPDKATTSAFAPPLPAEGAGGFRAMIADGENLYVAQAPAAIYRLLGGVWTKAAVEARCLEVKTLHGAPAMGACLGGVIEPDASGTWRVTIAHEGLLDAARMGKLGFFAVDQDGLALRSAGTEFTRVMRDRPVPPGAVVWSDDREAGALEAKDAMVFTDEALAPVAGRPPRQVTGGPGFVVRAAVPFAEGRLAAVGEGVAIHEGGRWRRLDRAPRPVLLGGDGGEAAALVLEAGPKGLRLVEIEANGTARPLPAPAGAKGFGATCVLGSGAYLLADAKSTVFRFEAGRWVPSKVKGAKGLHALACLSDEAYLVGDRGLVAHWNGGSFTPIASTGPDLSDVAMPAPGRAVAVGKNGTILIIEGDRVTRSLSTGSVELRSVAAVGERLFVATGAGTVEEFDLKGEPVTIHELRSHDPDEDRVDVDTLATSPDGTLFIGGPREVWALRSGKVSTLATWLGKLSAILPTADGNLLVIAHNAVIRLDVR